MDISEGYYSIEENIGSRSLQRELGKKAFDTVCSRYFDITNIVLVLKYLDPQYFQMDEFHKYPTYRFSLEVTVFENN